MSTHLGKSEDFVVFSYERLLNLRWLCSFRGRAVKQRNNATGNFYLVFKFQNSSFSYVSYQVY